MPIASEIAKQIAKRSAKTASRRFAKGEARQLLEKLPLSVRESLAMGIESSTAKKLVGETFAIPATGEEKIIQNIVKDKTVKSKRWMIFTDGSTIPVGTEELHRLTAKVSGAKYVAEKEELPTWWNAPATLLEIDRKRLSRAKKYASFREAKITLNAYREESKAVGRMDLTPYTICERDGWYVLLPEVSGNRLKAAGEVTLPKR